MTDFTPLKVDAPEVPQYGTSEFAIMAKYEGQINELKHVNDMLRLQIQHNQELLAAERKHQEHLMTIIQSLAV